MSQDIIYEFLSKNKGMKFTPIEIRINLGIKEQACFNNLRRLVRHKDVVKKDHKYWVEQ